MKLIALFICVMLFTSCGYSTEISSQNEVKDDEIISAYEPKDGVYVGLLRQNENSDTNTVKNIDLAKGYHNMYAKEFYGDDKEGILEFILECYSEDKMPYVIINMESDIDMVKKYDIAKLLSRTLGEYKVPIMAELYPMESCTEDGRKLFEYTAKKIRENTDTVAIIWAVESENIMTFEEYKPNEEYIDWVSFSCYKNVNTQTQRVTDDIDIFVEKIHNDKPIIMRTGISHYSSETHSYSIAEATDSIESVYNSAQKNYPYIKGVVYMNYTTKRNLPRLIKYDIYDITEDKSILEQYISSIKLYGKIPYTFL